MTRVLLFVLLVALAGCAPAPAPEPVAKTQDASAEFKPLAEKILAGWATLDTKNVAPFYAKEAGLTFYDIAPLKYSGWAEYEAGFQKVAAGWKSIKMALNPDLQASRNGNIAWSSFTFTFEIEPKEGAPMKGEGRASDVYEKRGNDWIIIHEHVSAPMPEEPPAPAAAKKK